jgi:hypothetical protein
MPERETIERARQDAREGKSPSTQAGEFVREEMHHIREGKHGAASTKQGIAIGLSKARRSGVKLSPPRGGKTSASTSQKAESDYRKGQSHSRRRPSARRSRATSNALKKKGTLGRFSGIAFQTGPKRRSQSRIGFAQDCREESKPHPQARTSIEGKQAAPATRKSIESANLAYRRFLPCPMIGLERARLQPRRPGHP